MPVYIMLQQIRQSRSKRNHQIRTCGDEEIKNLYQQIVGSVDEYEREKGLKFFKDKIQTQMLKCFQDLKYL